jgi:hypothetical protein
MVVRHLLAADVLFVASGLYIQPKPVLVSGETRYNSLKLRL